MSHHAESKAESENRDEKIPETAELYELRRRLSLAPHNNELRLHLAQWLAGHGRRQEALAELRSLVHHDPNHLGARKLREALLHEDSAADSGGSPPAPSPEALH
jgi:thioredoxin-like negative regulator of GroEL